MVEVALFIAGYGVHLAGSCLLLKKIVQQKSVYGLSTDSMVILLAATLSRVVWSMYTRLIETKLAYLELIASTVVACALAFYCFKYRHTTLRQAPLQLQAKVLLPAAAALAFFVHPGSKWWTVQILVAFTMYAEAVALVPQLFLFRRMHEVENVNSHYVGLLTCSRAIRVLFWIQLYVLGEHFVGLLLADVLHCFLSADFLRLWVGKLRNGGQLIFAGKSIH